jgi:Spy/CpxP family protein refolding chaperone
MKSQEKVTSRLARVGIAVGVLVALGTAACAASVDEKPRQDEITAKALTTDARRHLHGPVAIVMEAARTHGHLSAAQEKTLSAISADFEADRESRKVLAESLRSSAVAVVRSGTSDSVEFDRAVNQTVASIEQHMDRSADALEEIHGTLDGEQRTAVAKALRARINEKFDRKRDGDGRYGDGLKRLAAQLTLSTLQIDKLQAMKKELLGEKERLRPSREELLGLVDAFEGEDFRSALQAFRSKKSAVLRDRVALAGERTDTVLTVLTPAQRDLLADLMKDGWRKVMLGDQAAPAKD